MSFRNWWHRQSGAAKVVTVLATLSVVEIGLCWSTPFTILPLYTAVFGRSTNSGIGLGLIIWQALLSIATLIVLVIAIIVWYLGRHNRRDLRKEDDDR